MKQFAKYLSCAAFAMLAFANCANAQTPDKPKKRSFADSIFVPPGETADGLRFPYWDDGKRKTMDFNVSLLQRTDLQHIQMKNAKIATYDSDNKIDLVLLLPYSVMDLDTLILTTDKPFVLKRKDLELMGESLEINTSTKEATIKGKIKMIIYNFQEPARKDHPLE